MKITKDILLTNFWRYEEDPVYAKLSESEKDEMKAEGYCLDEDLVFTAVNKDHDAYKGYWFLTMRYNLSNTPERDWAIHIDNNLHESVAYVDIGTVEQFNKLMDLMDIEYRLPE